MKKWGIVIIILGLIWALIAYNMSTTVGEGFREVHNIGLMEYRRNHIMLAGMTTIAGIILFSFGSVSGRSFSRPDVTLRPCPLCAERIQPAAVKCRFCGADVPKLDSTDTESKAAVKPAWSEIQRKNEKNDTSSEMLEPAVGGGAVFWTIVGFIIIIAFISML